MNGALFSIAKVTKDCQTGYKNHFILSAKILTLNRLTMKPLAEVVKIVVISLVFFV
jgi:hypothetical protein